MRHSLLSKYDRVIDEKAQLRTELREEAESQVQLRRDEAQAQGQLPREFQEEASRLQDMLQEVRDEQ